MPLNQREGKKTNAHTHTHKRRDSILKKRNKLNESSEKERRKLCVTRWFKKKTNNFVFVFFFTWDRRIQLRPQSFPWPFLIRWSFSPCFSNRWPMPDHCRPSLCYWPSTKQTMESVMAIDDDAAVVNLLDWILLDWRPRMPTSPEKTMRPSRISVDPSVDLYYYYRPIEDCRERNGAGLYDVGRFLRRRRRHWKEASSIGVWWRAGLAPTEEMEAETRDGQSKGVTTTRIELVRLPQPH